MRINIISATILGFTSIAALSAQTYQPWMQQINAVFGTQGSIEEGGVLKWNLIRSDLSFHLNLAEDSGDNSGNGKIAAPNGVSLLPAMSTGEIAFKQASNGQILMTLEFPLREPEVNTFATSLLNQGARVTAIHNHYLGDQPKIIFVHADDAGTDPAALARVAKAAWTAVKAPVDADGESDSDDNAPGLNEKQIGKTIGGTANTLDGTVTVSVSRDEAATDTFNGQTLPMPSAMGPESDFSFQSAGNGEAAVIGEFCLVASEVPGVMKTLRNAGIPVTALHNHFLADNPHFFFLHIEATGNPTQLATIIHNALKMTKSNLQ